MFSKLFKPKDPVADFWKWFQANETALLTLMPENTRLWQELSRRIKTIHPNLTFEFNVVDEPPREFIVSANGDKAAFPAVRQTVAAAPPLPNWTLFAFRQPGKDFPSIELDGQQLEADNIFYRSTQRDGRLVLQIYLDGLTSQNERSMIHMTFLIFDSWFGEYDVESKLVLNEFHPLSDGLDGVKPLASLREELREVPGLPL